MPAGILSSIKFPTIQEASLISVSAMLPHNHWVGSISGNTDTQRWKHE